MAGRRTHRLAAAGIVLGSLIGATGSTGGVADAQPTRSGEATAAAAAPVVTGLEKRQSPVLGGDTDVKTVRAYCPGTKKVVGGGGLVQEASTTDRIALTRLEPSDNADGFGRDGYIVSAAETSPGVPGNWQVQAFVMCADAASVPGWHINPEFTDTTSSPQDAIAAACDNGATQRVIGTGARAEVAAGAEGEVVLQVARASGPGDIARAQSHEDANGFLGTHWLGAYAICMNTPKGYRVAPGGVSQQRLSESHKFATVGCGTQQNLSAGGAITDVAPGHVSLQSVFPTVTGAEVLAVENTPYNLNWDFIIARAICVDKT